MKKKQLRSAVAIWALLFFSIAANAQRNWDQINSSEDISRDTITQNGYTLYFINKDSTFDKQEAIAMQQTFFKVYPEEVKTYNNHSAKTVAIIIDPEYTGVAATAGNIVRINPEWMHKHPKDLDVITHEVMHIVQSYPNGAGPGWITEGIADYVRNKFGISNTEGGWHLYPYDSHQHYTDAYRITARFFIWIEKNYKKDLVKKLDAAMRSKQYSDSFWTEQTGQSVEQLWAKYGLNPSL